MSFRRKFKVSFFRQIVFFSKIILVVFDGFERDCAEFSLTVSDKNEGVKFSSRFGDAFELVGA